MAFFLPLWNHTKKSHVPLVEVMIFRKFHTLLIPLRIDFSCDSNGENAGHTVRIGLNGVPI
jgi:hypothetical protein